MPVISGVTPAAGVRYPETPFNGGFGPRVGAAYRLDNQTVVRAGYGVFYTQAFYPGWGGGMSLDGFNPQLSFGNSLSGYEPSFYLDKGFPSYSTKPNISLSADNGTNGPTYRPTYANHLSYTQQWNLTVERKLGNSSVVSVAYIGNKGTHLPSQMQPLNVLNPALLTSLGKRQPEYGFPARPDLAFRRQRALLGLGADPEQWRHMQTHCGAGVGALSAVLRRAHRT